jgi:hypothetical protein
LGHFIIGQVQHNFSIFLPPAKTNSQLFKSDKAVQTHNQIERMNQANAIRKKEQKPLPKKT